MCCSRALWESDDESVSQKCHAACACRELAQQIAMTAKPLKRMFGLTSICVYGGIDKQQQVCVILMRISNQKASLAKRHCKWLAQVDLLKQQPSILIATPGRLLDLVDDQDCDLTLGAHSFPDAMYPVESLSWLLPPLLAYDDTQLRFHSF